jgi:hypothetical protein
VVSFDIVSLFTKVPIRETMDLLGRHFEEDVLGLFRHVLTTSYFTFNGQFYEQTISTERVASVSNSWKHLIGSLKFSGHDPRTFGDTVPHTTTPPTLLPKLGTSLSLGPFTNQATILPPPT